MSPRELVDRLTDRLVLTFLVVGAGGYVVDVAVFNLLRSATPMAMSDLVVVRLLAVLAAMVVTYLGNSRLTWRHQQRDGRRREISLFVLFNAVGFAISAVCLLVSHHLLGLTGPVADNLSANVVGVGLGTLVRFITYRRFVFAGPPVTDISPAPRILIVSASVGAGHDGAACELARRAGAAGYAVDMIDFLDLLPLGTGRLLRSAYRWQLRLAPATWGWLLPLLGSRGGAAAARATSWLARRRLLAACHPEPCLAVSTYPLASQALSGLRLRGEFWSPVVTFLTDMSVHPLWIAPGVDAHLALHDIPATQAVALGARGVEVSGPAVSPAFVPVGADRRRALRVELGLPVEVPLALVVAGSWGVGDVFATVVDLLADGQVRPVVVCGSNVALRTSLDGMPAVTTLGWVDGMASLMQACDLVVQNAGGLSSLEARQCGLPVVTYRSIPGHGVTNSTALQKAGWARWAHSRDDLSLCVRQSLDDTAHPVPAGHVAWTRLALGSDPVPA